MEVVAAARESGVRTMVGYVYRFAPMVQHAKALVASGEIGEITHYHGRFLVGYAKDPNTPLSWRFDQNAAGYGALSDLMSHVLDMSHFLAGPIAELVSERHTYIDNRPVPSQSHSSVFGAVGTDNLGQVTNEDYVSALIRMESGARGHLEACRVISGPVCQMAFDIHGTRGAISWNLERMNELVVTDDIDPDSARTILAGPTKPGQEHFWPGPGVGIGYENVVAIQAAAMVEHMSTGKGGVPTLEDAGYVATAQQAMIDSWDSGGWTSVQGI
jgi:predicted dehydrogenase